MSRSESVWIAEEWRAHEAGDVVGVFATRAAALRAFPKAKPLGEGGRYAWETHGWALWQEEVRE